MDTIVTHKCIRCGYEWATRDGKRPLRCARGRCRSPYWDVERGGVIEKGAEELAALVKGYMDTTGQTVEERESNVRALERIVDGLPREAHGDTGSSPEIVAVIESTAAGRRDYLSKMVQSEVEAGVLEVIPEGFEPEAGVEEEKPVEETRFAEHPAPKKGKRDHGVFKGVARTLDPGQELVKDPEASDAPDW